MPRIPDDIRIAIVEFEKAVDVSSACSIQLFIAEKTFEAVFANATVDTYNPDEYDNAAQEIIRRTIDDIAAQFELMKKKKVLDVLVDVTEALLS